MHYNLLNNIYGKLYFGMKGGVFLIVIMLTMVSHISVAQSYNIDDVNGETIYLSGEEPLYLHDSGGPNGSYQNFEDYEVTICSGFELAGCPPPPPISCTFNFVDIEPNSTCDFDWLQIDNGPLYCNDNYPPLYGTTAVSYVWNESGCMNVRFHSDLSLTYEGFELVFEADHPAQYSPDPIECNVPLSGEVYFIIHGCPSCIETYTCGGNEYDQYYGAEIQYDIEAEGPVVLTIEGDVDFFVYGYQTNVGPNGCPPISSIACATGNQQSVAFNADDYPYGIWVIIDGFSSAFEIFLECSPCDPDPVDCGQIIHDFLNTGTDHYDVYDCVGPDYPYQEKVYAFTPDISGYYRFYTYSPSTAAPAIIVRDCCGVGLEPGQCDLCEFSWNSSSSFNGLEVFLVAGYTYYIFIEKALSPAINEFQFWIDCDTPLDCDPAPPVACGDVISGNNTFSSGAQNKNVDYCGHDYDYWTGREVVYTYYAETSGQVTLRLYNLQADLDLFVLEGCNADDCLTEGSNSGIEDELFTFSAEAGQTYYIVIDGYLGASSDYLLSIDCLTQDCKDCGNCFTYTLYNKGNTTDVTCIPKYTDCAVADYPTDDHTFQWTVDGVVKSTKYKPTLSLETSRKTKVCQIVRYFNAERYRCCWDIEPSPGCDKSPVAHVEMQGQWPLFQVTLDAETSENGKQYFWDFGDGNMFQNGGTDPDIEHTYDFGGYTYCGYVQNEHGISSYCKSFSPGAFECTGSENPQFTYSLTGRDLTIKEVNGSAFQIYSYSIDFGDSTTVVQGGNWSNRTHTFEKDSVYEVCVRFVTAFLQGGLPCYWEGCVCFTVRVNCCQQTVNQCYDLKPVFLSSNGGLEYRFEHQYPGLQVLQWEIDGDVITNSFGNTITYLFPQTGFYNVCCVYRDPATGCYIKCCKRVYIGDPFDPNECGGIVYNYEPNAHGYRFALDLPAAEVEEVQWTVDAPVEQSLGSQMQSNLLPIPGGPCQEYVISVRYFDKNCNCYRLCCLRVYVCAPSACASIIKSMSLGNGKTRFFTDAVFEQMQWYASGQLIGSGASVDYAVPTSGASVCLYYFDPVSQCHRVCCRDLLTSASEIASLAAAEIFPNPAGDELNIHLSFYTPVSAEIELMNDLGIVVRRIPAQVVGSTGFVQRLEMGDLPPGLYLVRIRTPEGEMTRKIIHL